MLKLLLCLILFYNFALICELCLMTATNCHIATAEFAANERGKNARSENLYMNFINLLISLIMKTKVFLLIVALFSYATGAFSQSYHYSYTTDSLPIMSSTVVVHNTTGVMYQITTIDGKYLAVSELDAQMHVVASNSKAFQINDTVYLKGSFFDPDDNIVVYGYRNPDKNGIIIKIMMNNSVPQSILYWKNNVASTQIIDGCNSGVRRGAIFDKKYDFVTPSYFMRIDYTLLSGIKCLTSNNTSFFSVEWNPTTECHVLSGTKDSVPFIAYLGPNGAMTPKYIIKFDFPTGATYGVGTNRHVLFDNDSITYLCQDIRYNDGDGLWICKVNYLADSSNILLESNVFLLGMAKVWLFDAVHTSDYLFVLGHHNGLDTTMVGNDPVVSVFERRFLFQYNMYDPTDYKAMLMSDFNLTNVQTPNPNYPCYEAQNTLYLNNMTYNPFEESVISAGAVQNAGYLVRTLDLNYDEECDIEQQLIERLAQPQSQLQSEPLHPTSVVMNDTTLMSCAQSIEMPITGNLFCPEDVDIAGDLERHLARSKNRNLEKSLQQNNYDDDKEMKLQPLEIEMLGSRQFVCRNVVGQCRYQIIDVSGRVINEGITRNDEINDTRIANPGIYLLYVIDDDNNVAKNKFVIFE